MIHNFYLLVNGSSLALPAHGLGGARATSLLAAHFALRNTASNSAEKKSSPSEGVAEGGGWGRNSVSPEPKKKPRRPARSKQTTKEKFCFPFREKIGRINKIP